MTHVSSGLNELLGEKIQNIALCFSSVLLIVQLQNQTAFKMTQADPPMNQSWLQRSLLVANLHFIAAVNSVAKALVVKDYLSQLDCNQLSITAYPSFRVMRVLGPVPAVSG